MQVQYIGHSGFAVEMEERVLLFDYYQGQLPRWPEDKPVYVFVSHAHHDHFTFQLFEKLKGRRQVEYIFSSDVRRHFGPAFTQRQGVSPEVWSKVRFVAPHTRLKLPGLELQTLESTDEGVAFVVECEGKRLYHAGDLHLWTWRGEPDEDNRRMRERYLSEMERLRDVRLDVAFAVLDPRQEEDFWQGLDVLMRTAQVEKVWPMHFWGETSVIDRLLALPCSEPYRERVARPEEYDKS
ncbi:MAG: MBL fold metallo-hydrolase [Eubacteriales bacterium]|jgi:L-ascorbate metabolism protein UlaG (beta-lactamase superfamily)